MALYKCALIDYGKTCSGAETYCGGLPPTAYYYYYNYYYNYFY